MYYYPIYPISQQYLYPPSSLHFHTEISAIRHGQFLREQNHLSYLSYAQLELKRLEKTKYQAQLYEKQLKIASILNSSRAQLEIQRQLLQQRAINEQLRMKEELRRLERQRLILYSNESKPFLTDRKQSNSLYRFNDSQGNSQINADLNKQTAKFKSVPQGGEILNFKPKETILDTDKTAKEANYPSSRRKRVQSLAKDISYNQQKDPSDNVVESISKRRSSILKNSSKNSPSLKKSSKRVKFVKDSPFNQEASSYCLNNSALKAAMTPSRKDHYASASKKIENRLKLSLVVYRDSQFRNIKHEIDHLFNTYETQCRLRREMKAKVNGRDQVIQKYNIVVEDVK